jgi:predicted Rossmann-fold nucleotide-binding protein
MRIGVIGPTDIHATSTAAGLDPALCELAARQAGEGLAERGHELVVVPDRGVGLLAAEAYHKAGGSGCTCIIPTKGTSAQVVESRCDDSRHLCDRVLDGMPWTVQHELIAQLADGLLCIGISCGTLSEIAWTKWVGATPVVVIRPLISGIPPEVEAETDLRWVDDLEGAYACLADLGPRKERT